MKNIIRKLTNFINKQTHCPAALNFSPTKLAAVPAALTAADGIACTVSTT